MKQLKELFRRSTSRWLALELILVTFTLWWAFDPVIVTNYVYFNPVTTVIFAWLILSERITIYFLIGTLLILTGMYLCNKVRK